MGAGSWGRHGEGRGWGQVLGAGADRQEPPGQAGRSSCPRLSLWGRQKVQPCPSKTVLMGRGSGRQEVGVGREREAPGLCSQQMSSQAAYTMFSHIHVYLRHITVTCHSI